MGAMAAKPPIELGFWGWGRRQQGNSGELLQGIEVVGGTGGGRRLGGAVGAPP
jgi:hypothetical protein